MTANTRLNNRYQIIRIYKHLCKVFEHGNIYFSLILNLDIDINFDLDNFKNNFENLKIGGICYNHTLKRYCDIDLYNDDNIIDISTIKITKEYYKELLIKLIISNKKIINIFNPITGILFTKEISDDIKNKIKL
jgi:hypothetical protein